MALVFYFSGGGSASSVLGGAISSTALTETIDAVFPSVSSADAIAGITHYACIYLKNTGANTTTTGVYFPSIVTATNVYVAKGIAGKNTSEQTIASNVTAPTGAFVFTKPNFVYSPLNLVALSTNDYIGLWLKRVVVANTAGSVADYVILTGVST